jgi:DNA-damage-inducible protein D
LSDQDIFQFDEGTTTFEDYRQDNGEPFWWASDLMKNLGYENPTSFRKAINRAMVACNSLNIPISEVFREERREIGGKELLDYRLTRFGCYLVSMNSDVRKPQVAAAQRYFITMAEAFRQYIQDSEQVERLFIREKLSEHEMALSDTVDQAGIENYAFFRNEGYRGLYNMSLKSLRVHKKMPIGHSKRLSDYMGKEELAANLFRITQTEAKIKNEQIHGQEKLEIAAYKVGRYVRNTMIEISGGKKPEDIPLTKPIAAVKQALRISSKKFKELDAPKSERKNKK